MLILYTYNNLTKSKHLYKDVYFDQVDINVILYFDNNEYLIDNLLMIGFQIDSEMFPVYSYLSDLFQFLLKRKSSITGTLLLYLNLLNIIEMVLGKSKINHSYYVEYIKVVLTTKIIANNGALSVKQKEYNQLLLSDVYILKPGFSIIPSSQLLLLFAPFVLANAQVW